MEISLLESLVIACAVGAASGGIGAFVILKRMSLVGDALSHVALPGIAIALAYGIDPFWGVIVTLIIAGIVVWKLETATNLPADAIVGLLFTASLAVGVLTIPDHEIIESLFGEFPALGVPMFTLVVGGAIAATITTLLLTKKFVYQVISKDLAQVSGIGEKYNLALMLLFVLVVALGIKLVGTLLMGALTIIPGAIARNVSRRMRGYIVSAMSIGGVLAGIGAYAAHTFGLLPGPTIILLGVGCFVLTFFWRRYAESA